MVEAIVKGWTSSTAGVTRYWLEIAHTGQYGISFKIVAPTGIDVADAAIDQLRYSCFAADSCWNGPDGEKLREQAIAKIQKIGFPGSCRI